MSYAGFEQTGQLMLNLFKFIDVIGILSDGYTIFNK